MLRAAARRAAAGAITPVRQLGAAATAAAPGTQSLPLSAALSSAATMATSAAAPQPEILAERRGSVQLVTLNRPKALNSLSTNMVESMYPIYAAAAADPAVACVLLRGAGGKAFCAGGDVKTVVQLGLAGKVDEALRFFDSEYKLNWAISQLPKPHVAVIDGICFGGGVGLSVHGTFRVATERTLFAMPECAIGLFPDVGGSYFLPRLPGSLGLWLALTGERLKGVDVLRARMATHYVPSALLPELEQAVQGLGPAASDARKVKDLLDSFQAREPLPAGQLAARLPDIELCFGGRASVEEVYKACEELGGQWGIDQIALMSKGSPTSQKLSFEQIRRGGGMPLDDCLRMEARMVHRCVERVGSDFYSGVSAMLIDRTNNPAWSPASLKDVSDDLVQSFFAALPREEELQLPPPCGRAARL